jgi:hypothetical protein
MMPASPAAVADAPEMQALAAPHACARSWPSSVLRAASSSPLPRGDSLSRATEAARSSLGMQTPQERRQWPRSVSVPTCAGGRQEEEVP